MDNGVPVSYTEHQEALATRIRAHKLFSNFSLEDWIIGNVPLEPGQALFDLGCGNGNLFPVYDRIMSGKGIVVGMDQNRELLEKAAALNLATPVILCPGNMDDPFPFLADQFHVVISTFAVYYTRDSAQLLSEVRRILKPGGHFFFIGPGADNAKELYAYNKLVFGFAAYAEVNIRTTRLQKEFLPGCGSLFTSHALDSIGSKLVFPDQEEYLRYYMNSLLFEESAKKAGRLPTWAELLDVPPSSLEISKEMVVLRGVK